MEFLDSHKYLAQSGIDLDKMWAAYLKNSVLKLFGPLSILKMCWGPQRAFIYVSYTPLYLSYLKLKLGNYSFKK